jgi:hypothetical protein
LTRYPDIRSVWDFGKVFNNPFRKRFFKMFGRDYSLDMIEHDTIRARGTYDDPRIHFAVNCASVGCPMLREEAYVGERLERQLDEQTARFLSDRSRTDTTRLPEPSRCRKSSNGTAPTSRADSRESPR